MLSVLHIENIALIESLDISFDHGLNVLTGETGAGKSIVLDAISAVMGERTSRDLIRSGETSALVSGVFSELPNLPWFEEMEIYPDENGELLISRKLLSDGKNICRVGGIPCTVLQLRALGRQLVNIHGQHDSQALLDERSHLSYLDSFGDLMDMQKDYSEQYEKVVELKKKMDAFVMDEAEKSRRIDMLDYQIKELQQANIQVGEEEELRERREILRSGEKLMDAVERAYFSLAGNEDLSGAVSQLEEAERALLSVANLSSELDGAAEAISELHFAAEDILDQVRDMRDQFDFAPEELDQVEGRLDVLYRMRKKYGNTEEEMLSYLEKCQTELDEIQMSDAALLRLEKEYALCLGDAREKAKKLSEARLEAGRKLEEKVEEGLRQLDMPNVRFCAKLTPKEGELGLDQTGMDNVQFLMSANLGEELKPIQKVASGGELSRIMLALKDVLTENDQISTLIFDEIDAGISGRAAQKVARKMGSLGGRRQILCVTHLAQIAAMADQHFLVEKGERDGRTYTEVRSLSREERVMALARLTGGEHLSDAILEGAGELLDKAEKDKSKSRKRA